jgi:GNAT superfamily N-acetyltransferase
MLSDDRPDPTAKVSRVLSTDQFGDYQLRYHTAKRPEEWEPRHIIEAYHPDEEHMVGRMAWNSDEILRLEVAKEHQRRGLATAMWHMGQRQPVKPRHSEELSDEGEAWMRSVGGS